MTAAFDKVWARIERYAGEVFRQVKGGEFAYSVKSGSVIPDRTNRKLPKTDFEKAFAMMPVGGPGALQHLQGPSYLYAILTDDRIRNDQQ